MSLVDPKTLPLNTPLVMATSSRENLNTPEDGNPFVKLCSDDNGMVSIRTAANLNRSLVLTSHGQCFFRSNMKALEFKVKMSSAGGFVFEEHLTGHVLEIEVQGDTKLIVCRNKYTEETQSWYLLEHKKMDSFMANPVSINPLNLVVDAENEAGRRQLIIHFLESGKSIKDVSEILTLRYGSTALQDEETKLDAIGAERRQLIVRYLQAGKSIAEVGEILTLLYGTTGSAPLRRNNHAIKQWWKTVPRAKT